MLQPPITSGRLPARSLLTLISGTLILLVITAELPALLVLSFTRTGPSRSHTLITLITDWTRTLTPHPPADEPTTYNTSHPPPQHPRYAQR